jgi:hypothetical protein
MMTFLCHASHDDGVRLLYNACVDPETMPGKIMGRSLHNKIYLGRRHALFNVRRAQISVFAGIAAGGVLLMLLRAFS